MNWKKTIYLTLGGLVVFILLSACGPSQDEIDATSTQLASNIFATQTANAPTSTLTPTPTNTPTPTSTSTPTPTNTPTITPTPTPDFASVTLNLDDLPPGFEELPPAEFGLEPGEDFGNSKVENSFTFLQSELGELIVGASILVPTMEEQDEFDSMMPFMVDTFINTGHYGNGDEADQGPVILNHLNSPGDVAVGSTTTMSDQGITTRLDIIMFRRGEMGVMIYSFYEDGTVPVVPIVDAANTLDTRIIGLREEVLFFDDFSNSNSGWDRYQDQVAITDYENGIYRMFVNEPEYVYWSTLYKNYTDTRIEVLASKVGGPDENYFGVICRYQDPDNYYNLTISSDGFWGIYKVFNGEWELLGKEFEQFNEYINQGQATNKIRADCIGDKLALYVNGEYLFEVEDDSFSDGDVGLLAGTYDVPGTDIHFDNFIVLEP